jgi:hypothetical protein
VYCVDGAHAWVINPATLSITKWAPTSGALPGATEDPDNPGTFLPGTTTATIIAVYRGRIWLGGMKADPQNVLACAVNNPLDWDTNSGIFGQAFGLTAAQIGRIGQPVTCLVASTRNSLVIGCKSSIWELVGDPTTGIPDLYPILTKHGISGKDAVTAVANGRLIVHTTGGGAYLLPDQGEPVPLSAPVLTEGIQIAPDQISQYVVQVRRDPQRSEVYFFLTKRAATANGSTLHIAYDEKIADPSGTGVYTPSNGGWEPDYLSDAHDPTASTPEPYQGRTILGTRDGYLMYFDPDATTDDGDAILVEVPLVILGDPRIRREVVLNHFSVLPADGAVVKYRVFGALTPQTVCGYTDGRTQLFSGTCNSVRQVIRRKVRMPALMVQLYSDTTDYFALEDADAVTTVGRIMTQRNLVTPAVPGAPCRAPFLPPDSSSSGTTSSFDSGPGNGTQFSSDEGTTVSSSGGLTLGSLPASTATSPSLPVGFSSFHSAHGGGSVGSGGTPVGGGGTTGTSTIHCTAVTNLHGDAHTICQTNNPRTAPGGLAQGGIGQA